MEAQDSSEVAALAAKVEELTRVCARLSEDNAGLHGMIAQMRAAAPGLMAAPGPTEVRAASAAGRAPALPTRAGSGPVSRRSIGKALGAAAAGVVGAAVLGEATAGPAAAANGDAMTAGHSVTAEAGTGVEYDGSTNPGAIFATDDSGSFAAALLGAALTHPAAILGNATAQVNNGVYGNTAHTGGGDGVVGVNNSPAGGNGVHGIANRDQAAAIGVLGENSGGVAVSGKGGTVGVEGSGTIGVQGTGGQSGTGVIGIATQGTGVSGTSSTGTGVHGKGKTGLSGTGMGSNPVGVAGSATSPGGRGGVFAGKVAQLKLTPGTRKSHPASGQRGDLYADSTGRLWFCKGRTSWHQVA